MGIIDVTDIPSPNDTKGSRVSYVAGEDEQSNEKPNIYSNADTSLWIWQTGDGWQRLKDIYFANGLPECFLGIARLILLLS